MDFNSANLIVKYSHKISELAKIEQADRISPELYERFDVKRGLRDKNGRGVLCGLTEISEVTSWHTVDGVKTPIPGILCYRGYNIKDLVANCVRENRFGFEETVYLLLFGSLGPREFRREFQCVGARRVEQCGVIRFVVGQGHAQRVLSEQGRVGHPEKQGVVSLRNAGEQGRGVEVQAANFGDLR